jgi:MFS family permease
VVAFVGITVAIGWVIDAYATSLEMLYLGAVVSGLGGGAVYATCVGNAVKWFPDRRGLAVGLTAAGYGAGAALTVIPIRYVIDNYGYNTAFLWFGVVQGRGRVRAGLVLARTGTQRNGRGAAAEGRPVGAELLAEGSAALAGILAALPHVRDGIGLRPDGYRADRAHRGRL